MTRSKNGLAQIAGPSLFDEYSECARHSISREQRFKCSDTKQIPYLAFTPYSGVAEFTSSTLNYLVMPIVLDRLTMQLANLKVMLEEAVKNNRPFLEQARISKQIVELEHSIEKRKEFLKRQDSTN